MILTTIKWGFSNCPSKKYNNLVYIYLVGVDPLENQISQLWQVPTKTRVYDLCEKLM